MINKIFEYFERHQEQPFIIKAFITIFLIIWLQDVIYSNMVFFMLLSPFFFLAYIRIKAAAGNKSTFAILKENLTFIPFMYSEKERKKEVVAWVTYGLITLNVLIYYLIELNPLIDEKFILNNFLFLPYVPNLWNGPVSVFSSMFLHADQSHLWGNMTFLWIIGTVVERRIGWKDFLLLYLITGLGGSISYVAISYLFNGEVGHALGASGAIAGVMGIFAVRCYFKSMVFPVPILGIFSLIIPLSLKVRLNSIVIMGMFFLMDLSGGIGQITGTSFSNVGHWAHLGGMAFGMVMAGVLGLGKQAIEEKHLEIGISASNAGMGFGEGEQSLKIALEKNPDNYEAFWHLARMKTKLTLSEEGKEYYQKAIAAAIKTRPQEAANIYKEYYQKFLQGVEPELLYRLAGILYKNKDLDLASRSLEMLSASPDTPPQIKERAMFQCGMILEEMGLTEAAMGYYSNFVESFPNSAGVAKAKMKLGSKQA